MRFLRISGGWSSQNAEQKMHFYNEKLFLNNTTVLYFPYFTLYQIISTVKM